MQEAGRSTGAFLGTHYEDNWKPRGNKAKGDNRPYLRRTRAPRPDCRRSDEYNPGVAWWGSKRIWLGHKPKGRYRREVRRVTKRSCGSCSSYWPNSLAAGIPVSEIHEVGVREEGVEGREEAGGAERSPADLPFEATDGPVESGRGRDHRCQVL